MKNQNISIVIFALIILTSGFNAKASIYENRKTEKDSLNKSDENEPSSLKSKPDSARTKYPEPFLTIHLGAAYDVNQGRVQLNSGQIPGTKINLHDDLGVTRSYIAPRLNVIVNFGNLRIFAFDTYNVNLKGNTILSKNIKYGDTTFSAGNRVKTRMNLNYFSLSYINFFYNTGRIRVAFLAGGTALFYNLKLTNQSFPDFDQRKSIFVPLPMVGLNGSIYFGKNLFIRAVIKYSAWWSKNYNCNVLDINPYFEYYIFKNFGVGMRYNFGITSFQKLPDKKFNGTIKDTFSATAIVLVYRFVRKHPKG